MLSVEDRDRLRVIVRRVHLKWLPKELLTDYECDKLIDTFSEEVIAANLKAARDIGMVE